MATRVNKPELRVDTVAEWEAWLSRIPIRRRPLATAQEGVHPTRDHVRRGAGCRAVLRVDRRAGAIAGCRLLPAYLHATTASKYVVEGQHRSRHSAHRRRSDATRRPAGDRPREGRRTMGPRLSAERRRHPTELQERWTPTRRSPPPSHLRPAQNRFAMAFRVTNLKRPASRAARVADYVEMLKRGETLY